MRQVLYHPIRLRRRLIEHFLSAFRARAQKLDEQVASFIKDNRGHKGTYFIGRKRRLCEAAAAGDAPPAAEATAAEATAAEAAAAAMAAATGAAAMARATRWVEREMERAQAAMDSAAAKEEVAGMAAAAEMATEEREFVSRLRQLLVRQRM